MTNGEKKVVKHLEMIQGIVNRLGNNSFYLKGWSMALIVASVALLTKYGLEYSYIIFTLIIPITVFWVLDGYFLWQERLFRQIYNDIRIQNNTDFAMDITKHLNKPKCNWWSATFSLTLNIFYIGEILFVFAVAYVIY